MTPALVVGPDSRGFSSVTGSSSVGHVGFLKRHQAPGVPEDVGVGEAAVGAQHGGIGSHRIAEEAEELAPGRMLGPPLGRAHIAVAVAYLAVLDEEAVDHAVAASNQW